MIKILLFLLSLMITISGICSELTKLQNLPPQNTWTINYKIEKITNDNNTHVEAPGDQSNLFYSQGGISIISSTTVGYSFTDRLKGSIKQCLFHTDTLTTTYEKGSTIEGEKFTRKSKGPTDPSFSLKYRLVELWTTRGLIVDGKLHYSPYTGPRSYPSTTKNGNEKRGNDSFKLGIEIGLEQQTVAYSLVTNFEHITKSKGIDRYDSSKVTGEAYQKFSLGGNLQIRSRNNIIFNIKGLWTSISDRYIKNLSTTTKLDGSDRAEITMEIAYEVLTDKLMLSAGYEFSSEEMRVRRDSLIMHPENSSNKLYTSITLQI